MERKKLLCFSMFKTIYSRNEFSVYFVIESSSHVSFKAGDAVFHKIFFSFKETKHCKKATKATLAL